MARRSTSFAVGLDGDEIVSGHLGARQKLRNVERDLGVVFSLETGHRNAMGFDEYLPRAGHRAQFEPP